MENVVDLKMPGVMELGREDLKEVDGGGFLAVVGAVGMFVAGAFVGAALVELATTSWDECVADYKAGYQSTR